MADRKIKIQSEVPCVFSETGTHVVTMLFEETADDEGGKPELNLVHLSCECGEDVADISEALDDTTRCCGNVRDDVRRAARGEDPRAHDAILAHALRQIKTSNTSVHHMRAERRKTSRPVMKLEFDVNQVLPAGLTFIVGQDQLGRKRNAAIYRESSTTPLAHYAGRGIWKMGEGAERNLRLIARDGDCQLDITKEGYGWGGGRRRIESVRCLTCKSDLTVANRRAHIKTDRHFKKFETRLHDAMHIVSQRLGRRWF